MRANRICRLSLRTIESSTYSQNLFWGILQFRKMVIRIGKSKKMFEKNTLKCYDNKVDIKQGEKVTYGL